ncbi:MAG: hypothetical protein WCV85_00145 [Patescibacteria group bacterium]
MSFANLASFFRSSRWPTYTFAALCFVIAALIMLPGSRPLVSNMVATIPLALGVLIGVVGLILREDKGESHSLATLAFGCSGFILAIGLSISSFVYMPAYDGAVVLPNGDPAKAFTLGRYEALIAAPWTSDIQSPFDVQKHAYLRLQTSDGETISVSVWYEGDAADLFRKYGKPEIFFADFEQECAQELQPVLATINGKVAKQSFPDKCLQLTPLYEALQQLAKQKDQKLTCII